MRLRPHDVTDLRRGSLWSDLRSAEAEMERLGRDLRRALRCGSAVYVRSRGEAVDVTSFRKAGLRDAVMAAEDEYGRLLEELCE